MQQRKEQQEIAKCTLQDGGFLLLFALIHLFPLSRLFATRQFVYTPTEMVTKLLPRHHPVHSASFHALDDVLSSDGMSDATDIKQLCTVRAHKATHQILPNSTPREFRPGGTRFEA